MNSPAFKDFCKACGVSIRMRQTTKEELSELQKDKAFNFWHDFNDDTVDDLLVRQADLARLKFYLGKLGCAVEIKNLKNDRHCLLYVDSGFWIRRIDFPFQTEFGVLSDLLMEISAPFGDQHRSASEVQMSKTQYAKLKGIFDDEEFSYFLHTFYMHVADLAKDPSEESAMSIFDKTLEALCDFPETATKTLTMIMVDEHDACVVGEYFLKKIHRHPAAQSLLTFI